eukprot:10822762-Karenia_brevis.AAC.1
MMMMMTMMMIMVMRSRVLFVSSLAREMQTECVIGTLSTCETSATFAPGEMTPSILEACWAH